MDKFSYIHLYVEKFDRYENFILLDFVSDSEFLNFAKQLDYSINKQQYFSSMLLLDQVALKEGPFPKEGAVYKVPMAFLLELRGNYSFYSEGQSAVFAFKYEGNPVNSVRDRQDLPRLFQQEVSALPFTYNLSSTWKGAPCGAESLNQDIEVVVKQVGQGSWNEIKSQGRCRVVFDLGGSIFYSKDEVKALLGNDPFKDNPTLIISHWDIDHYNLLAVASDDDLKKLCCIYVPSESISRTSKQMAKRLEKNCQYLCAIESLSTRKLKRRVSLNVEYQGAQYVLMAGEASKNKNLSGLALIVWNNNSCMFFCADHSYQQVFQDMKTAFSEATKKLIAKKAMLGGGHACHMVVPHHGGNAGKINNSYFFEVPGKALVSTGKNNYGHPFECVRTEMCDMGFQWIRVDFSKGDIKIIL